MILITITVDGRSFTHELADGTPPSVVGRVIADRQQGIPGFAEARITSTTVRYGHGRLRRCLERLADGWLSVEPVVRYGLYVLSVALVVAVALGW